MIGILGATGAVGTAVSHELRAWNAVPLRLGSRSARTGHLHVDATDDASLRRFCDGCSVIVDCTGPSSPELVQRVAGAAFDARADAVTVAGGDFVLDAVVRAQSAHPRRTALVAAGMMPGLTALLPRALAPASRLTAYVGGRGAFTRSAAADFLAARGDARAPGLAPLVDVELPFFPGPVTAFPHRSSESERVARAMSLTDARWYTVFDGAHTIAALRDPERLARAATLDLFGRTPYQRMVFLAGGRALVLHGSDASGLTGAFAALAAAALVRGEVVPGVHYAGEILDPHASLASLRSSLAVTAIETPQAHEEPTFDEGTL